jgi:four helix bundle protein
MLGTLSVTNELTPQEYNTSVLTIWKNDRAITDWANGVYAQLELARLDYINYAQNIGVNYSKLRRASVSISSNIAEGINRFSVKDKAHFVEMAYGSLMEVSSQFEIAEELGYVSSEDRLSMDMLIEEEARLLSGLLNSYKPSTDSKH